MNLQEQVEKVIKYSQDYPFNVHADQLLADWKKAKQFYINLFGDKLIYEGPRVSYEFSEKDKAEQFKSFLDYCEHEEDWFDGDSSAMEAFLTFLNKNEKGFFENRVVAEDPYREIAPGMKLSRCFKTFFPDNYYLRQAQDAASRIMQASKIEGRLYLSVHPLDFLTLGENNCKWRSCHALDGEFRAGNLSYMVDTTTIIAYLASEKQEQLRCMPEGMLWNSKKWRMLVHTNQLESCIYYNRQYPFTNQNLLDAVYHLLNTFASQEDGVGFIWPRRDMSFRTVRLANGEELNLEQNYFISSYRNMIKASEVIDTKNYTGYSDLVWSPHYSPIYSWHKNSAYPHNFYTNDDENLKAFHKTFDIAIGGKYKCLKCGKEYAEENDSFLCFSCIANEDLDEDRFMTCACCGSRIYDIDDAHEVNGEYYCTGCYMNLDTNIEEEDNLGEER